jgi:hypothetical protein
VVFAPHSRWRAAITPVGRGNGIQPADTRTPAQRLKRVFKLDLQSCEGCGGQVRVIACIEDPLVIGKILAHLETRRPEVRGPPPGRLAGG